MGRRAAKVEYLERLVEWAGGRGAFTQKTGIRAPDISSFLNGVKPISWKRLRRATEQVFGEPPAFVPVREGWDLFTNGPPRLADIGSDPGIYAFYDSAMRVIYFGKAMNLYAEVRQALGRHVAEVRPWTGNHNLKFRDITHYLSAYTITRSDADLRHDVEALFLRVLVNNTFNKKGGHFIRKA